MNIEMKPADLKQTTWKEYIIRFVFGGLVTAAAGLVAQHFGPVIGGLFLAFPAIFPASVTLIEKHETNKKAEQGLNGTTRGRDAASVVAAGSALGSLGMIAFAGVLWGLATWLAPWLVLLCATAAWFAVATLAWLIRRRL